MRHHSSFCWMNSGGAGCKSRKQKTIRVSPRQPDVKTDFNVAAAEVQLFSCAHTLYDGICRSDHELKHCHDKLECFYNTYFWLVSCGGYYAHVSPRHPDACLKRTAVLSGFREYAHAYVPSGM